MACTRAGPQPFLSGPRPGNALKLSVQTRTRLPVTACSVTPPRRGPALPTCSTATRWCLLSSVYTPRRLAACSGISFASGVQLPAAPTYCCIAGPLCSLIELPQAEPFTLTTACCRGITLPCGTPAGPSHPHSVRQRSCDKGPDCQTSKVRRLRAMQMSEPRTTTSGRCNPSVAHFPKFQTFATHP